MKLIADLHIHSRFSRATSKSLDFVALHASALEKGIGLVGTGDFTHPGWMAEIEEQLEPAEEGLLRLKPELRRLAEAGVPRACAGQVRFVLQVEISNIYKKADRTRKNHNLVFVPSLDAARAVTEKLSSIGNVASDGRPILGLDARDLLEITLESDPLSFLVPAHIWTPWFSVLGSKSGFDSIEECFGDLCEHIFAVETGLSSDPAMNWRLSRLDRMTLVSNSDAHSAAKLGREANLLDIEPGYLPLLTALKTGQGFGGTIEFFPEEGKYHLDGHRKCGVRLDPEQTRELGGRCPECGGKLTVGVMSRVRDLADRPEGFEPEGRSPFESLVPLDEVAGEVIGVGSQSKKVRALVERVLGELGPELQVLMEVPLEEIARVGGAPLAEAVRRIRDRELCIDAGFDGEFGTVRIFEPGERDHLLGQIAFQGLPEPVVKERKKTGANRGRKRQSQELDDRSLDPGDRDGPVGRPNLNPDQQLVVDAASGPLLVVAGPGTGKTRTLAARLAHQIRSGLIRPDQALAVTFTNQAALELAERLRAEVPETADAGPKVTTFHGLGLELLGELGHTDFEVLDDGQRLEVARRAAGPDLERREVERMLAAISLAKQTPDPGARLAGDELASRFYQRYEEQLKESGALDVDDLVLRPCVLLEADPGRARQVADRYRSVSVDEYQDVNDVQARLVELLCPGGRSLLAIGDPDQAIYGFRGARPGHFTRFAEVFDGAREVPLRTTYRLTDNVLAAAASVLGRAAGLQATKSGPRVEVVACPTPDSEAEQMVVRLERIIGGTSLFAVDSGRGDQAEQADVGFGDVAVLCRLKAQRKPILEALERSGIPCMDVGEDEPHDPRSQKVAVMTMHASKGREFQVVFAAGVEPGLVPLGIAGMTSDPAEERRLLYVAMTRARRLLVISHAGRRVLFGKTMPGGPSPFLADLPDSAVARISAEPPRKSPASRQLSLF